MFLDMLARARPLRDDRSVDVERAQRFARKVRARREEIGEHFPMLVQSHARAGADAVLDDVVAVRIRTPALGEVDDADRRVAVGRDEYHAAHRLRTRRRIARQQTALRMSEAQVDENRRAFGQHTAIGEHQRRNLTERVDLQELGECVVGLPRCGFDHAVGHADQLQRNLRCRGARSFFAIQRVHRSSRSDAPSARRRRGSDHLMRPARSSTS